MAKFLLVGAFVWPLVLGLATWGAARDRGSLWAAAVYSAAGRVCHQKPDRSFHTAGVQWPVCGRCAGLYAAAPIGALIGFRRRRRVAVTVRAVLAVASVPTAITLAAEWSRYVAVSSLDRFLAALPLGAALAAVVVSVASERPKAIE